MNKYYHGHLLSICYLITERSIYVDTSSWLWCVLALGLTFLRWLKWSGLYRPISSDAKLEESLMDGNINVKPTLTVVRIVERRSFRFAKNRAAFSAMSNRRPYEGDFWRSVDWSTFYLVMSHFFDVDQIYLCQLMRFDLLWKFDVFKRSNRFQN